MAASESKGMRVAYNPLCCSVRVLLLETRQMFWFQDAALNRIWPYTTRSTMTMPHEVSHGGAVALHQMQTMRVKHRPLGVYAILSSESRSGVLHPETQPDLAVPA